MSAADLDAEGLIGIGALAATVTPRVHRSTATRWVTAGVKINGTVVRLEGVCRGLGWYTSRQAYHRFLDAMTAARRGDEQPAPDRTPAKRRRAAAAANTELDKLWSRN